MAKVRPFLVYYIFPLNPFENCGLPPDVVLPFPFGTERRKFPYHLHDFPVPVSHQRKTMTVVSAISFGWFADFGNPLPLFNVHPTQFLPTNGKHPISPEKGPWLRLVRCLLDFSRFQRNDLREGWDEGGKGETAWVRGWSVGPIRSVSSVCRPDVGPSGCPLWEKLYRRRRSRVEHT